MMSGYNAVENIIPSFRWIHAARVGTILLSK
jgi:hypothetical protein